MKSIILAVTIVFACIRVSQATQPSFQFCGLTYNEAKGNMHLFEQLKEIPMCDPGSGSVWRVRYNPKTSDPSHIAALVCDFSQQIIINSTLGEATVTCVVRGKPAFDW